VPRGSYQLVPEISPDEVAAGLIFSPSIEESVTVTSAPVTNIVFKQAEVAEKGGSVGSFFFDRLLPGSYRIEARKAPTNATALQNDEWCWEEEGRADVAVFDSPVTNVQLAQRGWRMVVRAAMEDKFTLTHGDYDPTDFSVSPGVQEFCVESPGEYTLAMSHACAYYGALSFSFHTRQPKPILLTPTAYRVSGPLFLNTSLLPPTLSHLSLEASIVARISGNGGGSDSYGTLSVRRPPSREDPVAIYEQVRHGEVCADGYQSSHSSLSPFSLTVWYIHTHALISPQDSYKRFTEQPSFPFPSTPRLLFYPSAIPVTVQPFKCPPPLPPVYARPGVFLTATITPALPGVNEGYIFSPTGDNAFTAEKAEPTQVSVAVANGPHRRCCIPLLSTFETSQQAITQAVLHPSSFYF
ncbi:unnamed protein product, partial [Closterium sp. Naga37s-1]